MNGFLLINKPPGPTSHDIVNELRKITGIRQIGHAGTLDPFASGLLLVGVGEATKMLRHYVGLDKKYEAVLRLGATSDTHDRTGKVTSFKLQVSRLKKKDIGSVLKSFIGKQKQLPPMYSAKKIKGEKLYNLARKGQNIERRPVDIEVYDIKLISCNLKLVTCNFHASSGAYIRALAHDIGQKLGCGAYLEELKRTAIWKFKLADAISVIAREPRILRGDRSNPNDASNKVNGINAPQRDDKIASLPLVARNDTLTSANWQKHLIPLKTVLVSGTFDGVHEGHRNYFQQARQFGQQLICIVARDKIAEKIKGKKPRYSEKERVHFVKLCPEIDRVYLGVDGSEQKIYDFTASLKPDIIALGYDQTAYTDNLKSEMQKRGLTVKVVRLKPYNPDKYKSSLLNAV